MSNIIFSIHIMLQDILGYGKILFFYTIYQKKLRCLVKYTKIGLAQKSQPFFFLKCLIQLDTGIQYSGGRNDKFGDFFKIALKRARDLAFMNSHTTEYQIVRNRSCIALVV